MLRLPGGAWELYDVEGGRGEESSGGVPESRLSFSPPGSVFAAFEEQRLEPFERKLPKVMEPLALTKGVARCG